ncbi:MAG: bacterio-opsin activator domain-containing protein [Halobacterium sp.]
MTSSSGGFESLSGPEAERLVETAVDSDVSEALKERAMDEAPVGITISDPSLPDNPLVYVNRAYERLTGYSRDEVVGRNCRFLQGPDTREEPVAEMARAVAEGEPTTVHVRNYRRDGSRFWNRVDIAPIYEDGDLVHFVGFQSDVTRRVLAESAARERAAQYREEQRALGRVLDRVDDLLGSVTDALVQATTREALQRRVCRAVTGVDGYAFAWVGEYDPWADAVTPVVGVAGDGTEVGEFDLAFGRDDPVTRAVDGGRVAVVDDAEDRPGGFHGAMLADRYRSMAAVPLSYRESTYGVLCVYAAEPGVFDDHEREVLAAAGRAVATGLNAIRNHRRVEAKDHAELAFDLSETDCFAVAAARELGCGWSYVSAERASPDALALLFEADADGDAVRAAVPDELDVSVVTERPSGALFEVTVPDPSLVSVLAERGVAVQSLRASPDESRLVVRAPGGDDSRAVADAVTEQVPGAELTALRRDPARDGRRDRAGGSSELTDRQRAVLRRASAAGYFDSPRTVSGQELAASMGLAPATFHQHLRAALRKIVGRVAGSGDLPPDLT